MLAVGISPGTLLVAVTYVNASLLRPLALKVLFHVELSAESGNLSAAGPRYVYR